MFELDVDPDAFLAWLDSVDEQPPPVMDEFPFQDEFSDPVPIDPRTLSVDRQLGRLVGIEQQISRLRAEQQVLLAAINDGDTSVDGWSADLVSAALRVPSRTAQNMIATARTLTESLPQTLAVLASGDVTVRHAELIAEASWRLPAELAAQLEHDVLERAQTQTVAQLRASIRRSVLALDPDGAERRHRLARDDRKVTLQPVDDGMAELRALLPAPDAEAIYRRLSDATRLLPTCDERTRDQQRADLLVDAVLSGIPHDALPEQHGQRPSINVIITASTLVGHHDQPAWLDGYGPITADQARLLAADETGTWRRIITDPLNSQLLDYGTTVYRPPQPLADHVIARDPACVFPTCNQPSYRTDIDHIYPFGRGGPTNPANLAPLCRRHHNAKTRGVFDYARNNDGSFTWTDHHGNTYTSAPFLHWSRLKELQRNANVGPDETEQADDACGNAPTENTEQRQAQLRHAEDDSYRALVVRIEADIELATKYHDTAGIIQAERALDSAKRQRQCQLRHRDDPRNPPF